MGTKYRQGLFYPKNKHKYKGDHNKIVYRSSLELSYFNWFDRNENIVQWSSEETVIPYTLDIDNTRHRYFVDVWFKVRNKYGETREYIAEIKPYIFTTQEHLYTKKGKLTRSMRLLENWCVNQCKWREARKYAKKKNMTFIILTDKDLSKKL